MDHESPAVTEFIEVEINSAELTEFLEELSTIDGVKTKFIGDSAVIEKANTIAVTEVEIKGEPYYEEPIFQPYKEYEEENPKILDDGDDIELGDTDNFYYKTEPFFEVDPLENKDFLADNLLERRTLNSVAIVKLKKLNENLLQKFIGKIPRDSQAKKRKANHLKYLIETHYRAELYPNIKEPITLPNGLIMCHICYGVFNSTYNAQKHITEIHLQKPKSFSCNQCEKSYSNSKNLNMHVYLVHSKISRFDCPKCDEFKTQRKSSLFKHLRDIHLLLPEEIPALIQSNYKVNVKRAPNKVKPNVKKEVNQVHEVNQLNVHQMNQLNQVHQVHQVNQVHEVHQCHLCSYQGKNQRQLTEHIAIIHEGKKPFRCEFCGSCFGRKNNLKEHITKVHEGKKNYKCELCDYACNHKSYLAKHIQVVHEGFEGKKSFQCLICKDIFDDKSTLMLHSKEFHTVEHSLVAKKQKTHKCDICDYRAVKKSKLVRHVEAVHEGKKSYVCEFCSTSFARRDNLRLHISSVHEGIKPFKCDICNYSSAIKAALIRHILVVHERKKPYVCEFCGYACSEKTHLKQHAQSAHEGKKPEKPYMCEFCTSCFSQSVGLKCHISRVHKEENHYKSKIYKDIQPV